MNYGSSAIHHKNTGLLQFTADLPYFTKDCAFCGSLLLFYDKFYNRIFVKLSNFTKTARYFTVFHGKTTVIYQFTVNKPKLRWSHLNFCSRCTVLCGTFTVFYGKSDLLGMLTLEKFPCWHSKNAQVQFCIVGFFLRIIITLLITDRLQINAIKFSSHKNSIAVFLLI